MNFVFPILLIFYNNVRITKASLGDQLESYRNCLYTCVDQDCDIDGYSYLSYDERVTTSSFIRWPCFEECKYNCMWTTVDKLEEENRPIPQFYGKWPFIRFFGIQEPASTLFSLLNLVLHLKWIRIFRKRVSSNCPLYWIWHVFAGVCLHAWFWSVIFHARDTSLTEFMDYAGAFSIILIHCYLMLVRLCVKLGQLYCLLISLFFFLFYINHGLYLYMTHRIDYKYNMTLNFSIAIFAVLGWLVWSFWNRKSQPYVKKCATYVALTSLVSLLEIIDRPPLFYVFDSHSIWHLSTAFLIEIFYKFAISDCLYLKRHSVKETTYKNFKKPL